MNDFMQQFAELIDQIMGIPEESLNSQTIQIMKDVVATGFSEAQRTAAVNNLIKEFSNQGLTRGQARNAIDNVKENIAGIKEDLAPSAAKLEILEALFEPIESTLERAFEIYHTHDIVLPMTLDEGAMQPTYAHGTDAAADLYAKEDITLAPHSLSNRISTGVHIALPERWMAMIFPRSSIGMKTGLRLSNSAGIIDQAYHGDLTVLYDNLSDSEYTIHAGDRIAQLLVLPSYNFKAEIVETLPESERNEEGLGSTGV